MAQTSRCVGFEIFYLPAQAFSIAVDAPRADCATFCTSFAIRKARRRPATRPWPRRRRPPPSRSAAGPNRLHRLQPRGRLPGRPGGVPGRRDDVPGRPGGRGRRRATESDADRRKSGLTSQRCVEVMRSVLVSIGTARFPCERENWWTKYISHFLKHFRLKIFVILEQNYRQFFYGSSSNIW